MEVWLGVTATGDPEIYMELSQRWIKNNDVDRENQGYAGSESPEM